MPDTATPAPAAPPSKGKKAPAKQAAAANGGRRLVIVESPTKAKLLGRFLGAGYVVESSYGHIRDLPRHAADVPASHKGLAWAKTGDDVDNDFATLFVVTPESRRRSRDSRRC